MHNGNKNILNRVFDSIEKFRTKQINADDMVANLSGNISALEGATQEFIDNFHGFIGEIDFIKYTKNSNLVDDLILKEVNDYDSYLRKYFSNR